MKVCDEVIRDQGRLSKGNQFTLVLKTRLKSGYIIQTPSGDSTPTHNGGFSKTFCAYGWDIHHITMAHRRCSSDCPMGERAWWKSIVQFHRMLPEM